MDNVEQIFKLANIVQAVIVVLTGFVDLSSTFGVVLQGLFMLAIGGVIGALEFTEIATPICQKYGSFLFSFVGRGVFSLFLSTLVISHGALSVIAAIYLMLLGTAYIVLGFVPSINPPANMRDGETDGFSDDEIEGIV